MQVHECSILLKKKLFNFLPVQLKNNIEHTSFFVELSEVINKFVLVRQLCYKKSPLYFSKKLYG